ncbi:MAG: HD domain-containing protein [Streptosporangiales bacterium]|nr:HD domain-containing protein [Streptosporangiales bacterium]
MVRSLPRPAQVYICVIVALAVLVIAQAPLGAIDWPTLLVLALLFFICESFATLLPSEGRVHVSVSFSATLASVVLLGPVGAAVIGAVALFAMRRDGLPLVKRVFNGAQFALSAYAAGVVYELAGGYTGVPTGEDFSWIIIPFVVAVVTYVLTNGLLMIFVLVLTQGVQSVRGHGGALAPSVVPYLGYGMFGLLIAALWGTLGPLSALLVLLPLFAARWAFAQHAAQQAAHEATIAALCQAVETKDYYTRGHSERVSRASVMIAREIGVRGGRLEAIRFAGMLHDVGKLGVPTKVLQKSGSLTEEEFAAIQLHPMRGLEIVREIGFLDEALAGIMHHHERMDGRGYPMGLVGDEIPEFARVIAVADAFDSMTSTRSYRDARTVDQAIEELRRWSGRQFDPEVVDAFIKAVERHGWQRPEPEPRLPAGALETAQHDHDDPSVPLRVTGDGDK